MGQEGPPPEEQYNPEQYNPEPSDEGRLAPDDERRVEQLFK